MEILIWVGAALSLVGIAGLIWCVMIAARARKDGLEGPDMQARLQRVVFLNMGALFVSAIGLMLVVLGIFLT